MNDFPQPKSGHVTLDEMSHIFKATLTPRHLEDVKVLKFIEHFLQCRNISQASRAAGITLYRGNSLRLQADIHAAIEGLTQKSVMKYGFDGNDVVERVKEISNVDPIEFENADGSYKTHLSMISPEVRRAIKKFKVKNLYSEDMNGMKVVSGQLIEVELYDKMKAHELLGREKDLFKQTTKVQHDITENMKDVLLDSRKRGELRAGEMDDVIEVTGKTIP